MMTAAVAGWLGQSVERVEDAALLTSHGRLHRVRYPGLEPERGRLSVLQEAVRRRRALQCESCAPGFLMSLDCYLRTRPAPGAAGIRAFRGGHLCRRTGHAPIVAAALDAASGLREVQHA